MTEKKSSEAAPKKARPQNRNLRPPFRKGKGAERDPRINTKGPINNMRKLRAYIQAYLAEPTTKNKTRLDKLLDVMAKRRGDKLLEFGFGKVPERMTIDGDLDVGVTMYIPTNNRKDKIIKAHDDDPEADVDQPD